MPGVFANPILPGMHPDPSICRVGDDFYLVTSSFEYFPGVPIFHSRDLVHWRQLGHVLTTARQLDLHAARSSGGVYAPTLRHADGRFYVITTNVSGGGNFYVTAPDPAGPWSDPVHVDNEGFDPSLLFAGSNAYYLRDGMTGRPDHPQVFQAPLDPRTGRLLEPLRSIWAGTGGVWPEGAHVYQRGDAYYLFAAEGGTSYAHSEVVARGPSPFGPFEAFPGNPILSHRQRPDHPVQATGHLDLVDLADGTTWAVLLGIRPQTERTHHLGRETFLAPVRWTAEGWPVVGEGEGGTVELRMAAPALAAHPFPADPVRDDFARAPLAFVWNHLRNPDPRDWSLVERPGFLRLLGSAVTLDDIASPALVVRRQQHFRVRCETALDFSPRHPGEEAGLVVRASEDFHYALVVRASGAGREAALVSRVAGVSTVVRRAPLEAGPIRLRVIADESSYRFEAGAGGPTEALGVLPTRLLSAEEIGKHGRHHFTGAFIGMYATGTGQRSTAPADFDWFDYEPE